MPNTPIWTIPYPALSDPPNGPSQVQAAASRLETVLQLRPVSATSDVAAPYDGQMVYSDPDNTVYVYDDGAWHVFAPGRSFFARMTGVSTAAPFAASAAGAVDLPGATVTFTTTRTNVVAKIRACYDMEISVAGAGFVTGRCSVDGTDQDPGVALSNVIARIPGTAYWEATLAAAGSHTIKLRTMKTTNGGTATVYANATSLSVGLVGN